MALFSRDKQSPAPEPTEAEVDEIVHLSRAHTPSKGKATPKRTVAQRRKAEPMPANSREAKKRRREQERVTRAERHEGMKAGDERYLLPRDKGPERALVRNIVDSRRTVGPYFFAGAFVLLFLFTIPDQRIQLAANTIWFMLAAAVIIDSVFISRRVNKMIKERHPKTSQRMGSLYLYAIMRAISFRKLRMPKTQVNIGDSV